MTWLQFSTFVSSFLVHVKKDLKHQIITFHSSKTGNNPGIVSEGSCVTEPHCPEVSFFQSDEAKWMFEDALGTRTVRILSPDKRSWLVAQILQGRGFRKFFTTRAVVWHGPVGHPSPDDFDFMLRSLHKSLPFYTLFVQFRMAQEMEWLEEVFRDFNYSRYDRLNLLTPVADMERAWLAMSASRRRQIKKSVAAGLTVSFTPNPHEVKQFYQLLSRLYKQRIWKPVPQEAFFHRLNHLFQKGKIQGCFAVCIFEGRVVGGIICPETPGEVLHELYICGDDKTLSKRQVYPSVVATWAAMTEASGRGCHTFDFMGMGVPQRPYGVRDFKARFGGRWVNPGRWNKRYNRLLYIVVELLYNISYIIMHRFRLKERDL